MLQHAVALLLQRLLGKFVSFDASMLQLSLWQGDLSFSNLELRLGIGKGTIGHLSVNIPWRSLWTQSVVIKAQGIRIWAHHQPNVTPGSSSDSPSSQMETNGLVLNQAEQLDTSDAMEQPVDDRSYLSKLLSSLISNVQIELVDVQIRYDCMEDSSAKLPGSATLAVGQVSFINADADWNLAFTSHASLASRKLLSTERIAAYVEYEDFKAANLTPTSMTSSSSSGVVRKYLFHDWSSTIKANLCYNSANASFPDVDLSITFGSSNYHDEETHKCSICSLYDDYHGDYLADGDIVKKNEEQVQLYEPRVHFDSDHIDVLYAILIEVKAPYDEYDRLAVLSQKQASRPEGFLTVLAYAKQWLISDCLDGLGDSTCTTNGYGSHSDDSDDDDEFEDAITPPSLSISTCLERGVNVFFFSRNYKEQCEITRRRWWLFSLGKTSAFLRQSCIEDETHINVKSLYFGEFQEANAIGNLVQTMMAGKAGNGHTDVVEPRGEIDLIEFSCIIPAYQSRLVGHQPVSKLRINEKIHMAVSEETMMLWMTLFTPVWYWWNNWNLSHPSKLKVVDENRIAPIADVTYAIEGIEVFYFVNQKLFFGVELRGINVVTDSTSESVSCSYSLGLLRILSGKLESGRIISMADIEQRDVPCHEITVLRDVVLTESSHSRTRWCNEDYLCQHAFDDDWMLGPENIETAHESRSMYRCELSISSVVTVSLQIEEIESVMWAIGKWSYYSFDSSVTSPFTLCSTNGKEMCRTKWDIHVPGICVSIAQPAETPEGKHEMVFKVNDLRYTASACMSHMTTTVTYGSVKLLHQSEPVLSVPKSSSHKSNRIEITNRCVRRNISVIPIIGPNVMASNGNSGEVLTYSQGISIAFERIDGVISPVHSLVILEWIHSCQEKQELGLICSSSYGFDLESCCANLKRVRTPASPVLLEPTVHQLSITAIKGISLSLMHRELKDHSAIESDSAQELGILESGFASLCIVNNDLTQRIQTGEERNVRITLRNFQLIDLTNPRNKSPEMPHRKVISSSVGSIDVNDSGSFLVKNAVDILLVTPYITQQTDDSNSLPGMLVKVRFDSVCVTYLHRVYKQFSHYLWDHLLPMFWSGSAITAVKALDAFALFDIDTREFAVSVEEIVRMYLSSDTVVDSGKTRGYTKYELLANDLSLMIPRTSFSNRCITLRCTNGRFWSAAINSDESEFLQNGTLSEEGRLSHVSASGVTNTKAQQVKRTELRNLKRLIKNQRSRILNNRSQLYIDLKNATQLQHTYMHEGCAAPDADEAVRIIRSKVAELDAQVDLLNQHLREVDDSIEKVKEQSEAEFSRISDPVLMTRCRTESMEAIRESVANMSKHLIGSLFTGEDAEFFDARVMTTKDTTEEDMSSSSNTWFEFELVDLDGTTSGSNTPLFHHALVTGRIDSDPELLANSVTSHLNLSISLNELNVMLTPVQYTTLLGMIFENFKEVGSVVDEDTFPLCGNCGGYHYDYQVCNAIWLKIPVKVMDATLRVSNEDHCIADVCFEQLELGFTLRTDDSLEITASALTMNVIDMRNEHSGSTLEILRSLGGDGLQVEFKQKMTYTESFYELDIQHTSLVVVYDAIYQLVDFFITPFWAVNEFMDYTVGFMCPAPPDWKTMEFQARYTNSCFCLLEDFIKNDSRALVALTNVSYTYNGTQLCEDSSDMRKIHVNMDQRGFYISTLPGLEFDASYPVVNSFQLVFDHYVRWDSMSRRNSFVLEPVEARLSIQDSFLLLNVVNNYLKKITSKTSSGEENKPEEHDEKGAFAANTTYASDKLLGDVGEIRVVLVNNLLSVPIADFHVTDIECEREQEDKCTTSIGAIMSSNYFNNSIYRWEPLVEPFKIQMRVERALAVDSRAEVFVNLPFAVNLNMTPAMAPLLSSDALQQADFVTTGSKTTAPFWIQNKTGMNVKFSFRRGKGAVIQQIVPDDVVVPVDCREQGDMRSFDSASSDRLIQQNDNNYLTVNHTLSIWTNDNKWMSLNPVIVDVVGHVSIPLRNSGKDKNPEMATDADDFTPPVLVAEISIQADGSKLINLHSQVVLQNRTSVPLMIWAFSPRGDKNDPHVFEWIVDREQVCHVPLKLIHPNSKISVRPSPNVQYAPLATSLEDFGDEFRVHKQSRTKRFIRGGCCVCNFEVFDSAWEVENASWQPSGSKTSSVCPLSGFVVRDFAPWRCTYDVEAYYLMRAALLSAEDQKKRSEEKQLPKIDEESVEEDFRQVFSKTKNNRRKNDRLDDINDQLEDVTQHRGLYEATNYSMYHLSVSPFLVLHNHLASPVAYRIMISSLQLVAEGIIGVGNMLPLFQIDGSSLLYISFRLENYNWSTPTAVIHPKARPLSVPYKEHYLSFELQGRSFDREVEGEQGNVPNLQLTMKLLGREIFLFCSFWVVNHSGLCLEYCNSTSLTPKKLEGVLKYVHQRPTKESIQDSVFMSRSISYYNPGPKDDMALTHLQQKSASVVPVAVIVAIQEAKDLFNSQYFGTQSPYVRASLYAPKPVREAYAEEVERELVCFAETKPSPSGGVNPTWNTRLQNTLLLRFPRATMSIQRARIVLEVRNTNYGMDSCLGITAVPVATIMKDLKEAAVFKPYRLIKKRSAKERVEPGSEKKPPEPRGTLYVSFSVGTTQELSMLDADSNGRDAFISPMTDDDRRSSMISPHDSSEYDTINFEQEQILASQTPSVLPQSGMLRSIQKLHTPAQTPGMPSAINDHRGSAVAANAAPLSRRSYPTMMYMDLDSTRAHGDAFESSSTRPGAINAHSSPPKPPHGSKLFPLRVYLPTNRFVFVTVEVASNFTWSDVFHLVCSRCGFDGIFDKEDFDFYQLAAARFVSLRSAGRPESERWYGKRLDMLSKVGSKKGRKYGLHLCHRMAMTTIRLYDEASTASPHHFTPRTLLLSAKSKNPAQNSPMAWGEVLLYGSQGSKADVLRIKHKNAPWSEVVRLRRNAMGNSGVAQVITLVNEEDVSDEAAILKKSQIELALWTCYGTGRFADTVIATIAPRYILINRTGTSLKYRQDQVPLTCELPPQELKAFHWSSSAAPKYLQVTFSHGEFGWSARFRIHSLGTTYLKLRRSIDQSQIYILQCQTEMVGGSIALIFREESKRWPPYRIDNTTSFRIQFTQANWNAKDARYDELGPRSSCPYSWDSHDGTELVSSSSSAHVDPNVNNTQKDRFIKIRFMRVSSSSGQGRDGSQQDAAIETREYNLDQMASHRRIQLQRSLPSQLFIKPDKKGYLLKKDNLLKWNKKYFRLYDSMLYYFASEEDQELLGVIDLRPGASVPGAGSVAICEKVEPHQRSSFMSLNGLVSSISGTIFGSASFQDGSSDRRAEEEDEQARNLVQLAVSMTASSYLSQESERFVKDYEDDIISPRGFFVCGYALVDFLVKEKHASSKDKAFGVAQEMLTLGVLSVANVDRNDQKNTTISAPFQCSKKIWYGVNSINLAEESDSMESGDDIAIFSFTPTPPNDSSEKRFNKPTDLSAQKPTSTQFSIITSSKCYELKAKNPKLARGWVIQLRKAILSGRSSNSKNNNNEEESTKSGSTASTTANSTSTTASGSSNAKTYVHVRVRADGPTKVLELFEGGEEDYDETELRNEIVSDCGSTSPTTSESSTTTTNNGELTNAISIHVAINSFGISCVNEVPRELVYAYFGGVAIKFSRNSNKMKMMVTLDDFQVDNQHEGATFSKLICPRIRSDSNQNQPHVQTVDEDNAMEAMEPELDMPEEDDQVSEILPTKGLRCNDCGNMVENASMHFCCTWSSEQGGSTEYFKHCSFWLCPIVVQLDEELLLSCRDFLNSMAAAATHKRLENSDNEIRHKSVPIETMAESLREFKENISSEELDPLISLHTYNSNAASSERRKVYFALLHIHPIEFDITYRSDVLQFSAQISLREARSASFSASTRPSEEFKRSASMEIMDSIKSRDGKDDKDEKRSESWAIPSLGMHIPDLDNAPVRLTALQLQHVFGTSGELSRRVTKYYTRQLWKQLHKILGSFDFLGNPVGFFDHIGTGVKDFVYEPYEGLKVGAKGFRKGLAKGTASLVSNTLDGTFDAASKISGTFGQGLATMSFDDHYQQVRARARRRHVHGIREGLVQGSRELSIGVIEGVTGLVMAPVRGAEQGALGFVKGTITGILGLPIKPVAGIFDFASRATQGIRSRSLRRDAMRRVRRPRVFGRYNELKVYKEDDTIAYDLLKRTGGDRLSGEKIIYYFEIIQSIPAAEMAHEGRQKHKKPLAKADSKTHAGSGSREIQDTESGPKLVYEVTFFEKKLGLELETDFYCENVTIKTTTEDCHNYSVTEAARNRQVLQEGDCLIGVGGVDVRRIGFHETLALLRGTARPITLQFESCEEYISTGVDNENADDVTGSSSPSLVAEDDGARLKVQVVHWLIVTEERVLYINVGSFAHPLVEWTTPLRYIYRVELIKSNCSRIYLHLRVGVDSLPTGPRLRPSWKLLTSHERDMEVFTSVMKKSFGNDSDIAEEQELWPSDKSLNGFLMKKGGFTTNKRWFVLSRNCLYYFVSDQRELRGIIPLGNVTIETDTRESMSLRITNAQLNEPLVTIQMDHGQVVEKVQREIVLIASNAQDVEMWSSSLAHAAGKGLRHSRGTRFFVPTSCSRLEIGCRDTPEFIVASLAETLKKTIEVFGHPLCH